MYNFVQQVLLEIKKILGFIGIANYCEVCGARKTVEINHFVDGEKISTVYLCPKVINHARNKPGIGGNPAYV